MWRFGLLAGGILVGGMLLAQEDPFTFMPDGGRGIFPTVFSEPGGQTWAACQSLDTESWQAEILSRSPDLDEGEARTLAGYLAYALPMDDACEQDFPVALPMDGKDLALAHCQSCHALFSGYLVHRRTPEGWLALFSSPFHSGIAMTPEEKAIFADYSTVNMPMRIEDVPPELRF